MTDLAFSPSSVDVSSESKDVTITVKVTDESGVSTTSGNRPNFNAYNFSADYISCANEWALASGTNKDGIWSVICSIPQGQGSGDYYFSTTQFTDANGLGADCYSNQLGGRYSCTSDGNRLLLSVDNSGASSTIYYLYGGTSQSDYLGTYGGSNTASDSICNSVGTYGSNVSSSSIWNTVGTYGGTVGTYSPWNSVSSNPPEFFNQDKSSSYGKFTVNTATANRTTVSSLTNIIDYFNNNSQDIGATRTNACSSATAFTQASQRSLLKTNRTSINVSKETVR